ncbi:hypothetical protein BGX31_007308, partial [Mortierella sp. GBA43]
MAYLGDTSRTDMGFNVTLPMQLQTSVSPSSSPVPSSSTSLPSSPSPSQHLYQTTSMADDSTSYGFALASTYGATSSITAELPQMFQSLPPTSLLAASQPNYYTMATTGDFVPTVQSGFSSDLALSHHHPMVRAQSDGGGIIHRHYHRQQLLQQDLLNPRMYATAPSPTPSSSDSSSSSSSSPPSAASSAVSSPTSPDFDEALTMSTMMTVVPVIACAACKRSHIKCDSGRPCQNCLKHPSKALTCRDAIPKPRGRPKGGSKAAAEALQLARLQQEQQQQQQQQQLMLREQQLQAFEQQLQQYQLQYQQQHQRQLGGHSRPRVMSLPQQSRPPHLSSLQVQQQPQQHASPYTQHAHLLSKSSPTSPAAAEHRAA